MQVVFPRILFAAVIALKRRNKIGSPDTKGQSGGVYPTMTYFPRCQVYPVPAHEKIFAMNWLLHCKKVELDKMKVLSEKPTLVISQRNATSPKIPFCDLFPPDLQLEWNTESRILSLLNVREPCIQAQQQFTRNEWLLLMSLIECYPHYTPHEMLLAELTLISYDDWRKRLQKIRQVQPEAIIQELKPVYRALSGVRTKLKKFYPQLKISLVRNMGYALSLAPDIQENN